MVGTTANYAFQYPQLTDAPNVPLHVQNLATEIDSQLHTTDTNVATVTSAVNNLLAGQRGAEYYGSTQTLTVGNDRQMNFPTSPGASSTSTNITPSGTSNNAFTVGTSGWYDLAAGCAWGNQTAAVYMYLALGTTTPGTTIVGLNPNVSYTFGVLNISRKIYLTAGQAVCVGLSVVTNTITLDGSRRNFISIVFDGP